METNFTFLISPADAVALEEQVSRALEKRVELASREGLLDPKKFAFTWVVDFPLFKPTDDPDDDDVAVGHSKWTSMHHPFTMPSKDWIDTFDKDPEHAMSDSYDIVCNGNEMAAPCVSTVMTFRIVCSMCSASLLKRLPTSSASCLKPSSTALRRTLASLSVGIVPPPSWLAPTPSATSSPSRRLAAVVIR